MDKIQIPEFADKSKLFDWLIENKSALIAQKKSAIKHADAIGYYVPLFTEKDVSIKSADQLPADVKKIKARLIINTTKLMDSHSDVHIDQLWNKSLKETKDFYHVQEHNFTFAGIISDNIKAFAKQMTWKDLGFEFEGNTQALIFDSIIDKERNAFMFEQYKLGRVKNHSVGMRYVTLYLCINDDRYEKEKANWDKYIDQVVNQDDAIKQGYFWAVTEAKIVEGSAVVKGSNYATPTYSTEAAKGTSDDIITEPAETTQKKTIFSTLKLQR